MSYIIAFKVCDELVSFCCLHEEGLPRPEWWLDTCSSHDFTKRAKEVLLVEAYIQRSMLFNDLTLQDTFVLIMLNDIYLFDGLSRQVTRGLVIVEPKGVLSLDIELINGLALVRNQSTFTNLDTRKFFQHILDIAILCPSEGLHPIAERITMRSDGRSFNMDFS